jgi:hypothetical protein
MCTWCTRYRLVELHTWKSAKTGKQLVGNVCGHCFNGGPNDQCRTCKLKTEKGMSTVLASAVAHELDASDVPALLEATNGRQKRRARS